MIRLIAKSVYSMPDGTCAGAEFKTFDGDLAGLESWLTVPGSPYECRSVVGVEIVAREAGQ